MFYPLDFAFVCPVSFSTTPKLDILISVLCLDKSEIFAYSDRCKDFEDLNCHLLAVSCDSVFAHLAWCNSAKNESGLGNLMFPIVADFDKAISSAYGILLPSGNPQRSIFIISPQGNLFFQPFC
jgi:peroxiredoxin (alkyl hydroperoxide reductase subunit C)